MTTTAPQAPRFSAAAVTTEPDRSAHRFILTGRSGIGKTFFTSTIPRVFILPIEEGLKGTSPDHNPAHFKSVPRTIGELTEAIGAFAAMNVPGADKRRPYAHLVLDSLTGIEKLAQASARHLGDAFKEADAMILVWQRVQEKLDTIKRNGTHVWLIAHATESVDAAGDGATFRKWDLQFTAPGKKLEEVRNLWRSWADHVFFLDWVANVEKKSKAHRSVGRYAGRVLHTRESASYYAKTRARLPPSMPATWEDLSSAMQAGSAAPEAKLRGELDAVVAQLVDEDRAAIVVALGQAKGPTAIAAILSRAQGMLAVSQEAASATEPAQDELEPSQESETPAAPPPASKPVAAAAAAPHEDLPAEDLPAEDLSPATAPATPAASPVDNLVHMFLKRLQDAPTWDATAEIIVEAKAAGFAPEQLDRIVALGRELHATKPKGAAA